MTADPVLTPPPSPARPPARADGPSQDNCVLCANVGAGCPYHPRRSR